MQPYKEETATIISGHIEKKSAVGLTAIETWETITTVCVKYQIQCSQTKLIECLWKVA